MDKVVSIIVPVYNVEDYLERCMVSLLRQTYGAIEIILVDDGSTDASGDKCDEYATMDERVKAYHQPNRGVSAARNLGIEHAHGDYLMYVDPDDWIDLDAVFKLVATMQQYRLKVLLFGCVLEYENGHTKRFCKKADFKMYTSEEALLKIMTQRDQELSWSVCGKIYSAEVAEKVRFPDGIAVCEDLPYCFDIIQRVSNVGYLTDCLYHYYMRSGSATNSSCSSAVLSSMRVFDLMHSDNPALHDAIRFAYYSTAIHCAKEILLSCQYEEFQKELQFTKGLIRQNFYYILAHRHIHLKAKVGAVLVCCPEFLWRVAAAVLRRL